MCGKVRQQTRAFRIGQMPERAEYTAFERVRIGAVFKHEYIVIGFYHDPRTARKPAQNVFGKMPDIRKIPDKLAAGKNTEADASQRIVRGVATGQTATPPTFTTLPEASGNSREGSATLSARNGRHAAGANTGISVFFVIVASPLIWSECS